MQSVSGSGISSSSSGQSHSDESSLSYSHMGSAGMSDRISLSSGDHSESESDSNTDSGDDADIEDWEDEIFDARRPGLTARDIRHLIEDMYSRRYEVCTNFNGYLQKVKSIDFFSATPHSFPLCSCYNAAHLDCLA